MEPNLKLSEKDREGLDQLVGAIQQQIAELAAKRWSRPQDEHQGRKKMRLATRKMTHAKILLVAGDPVGGPAVTKEAIAQRFQVSGQLVELVCNRYSQNGLAAALDPGLTQEERAQVARWYEDHGSAVATEVQRWLRGATKRRTGVSTSAIAASVWASFAENHFVDVLDPTDPQCAWNLLTCAAKRHCEAWNRYGERVKERGSLEELGCRSSEDGSPTRFDPEDTRDLDPIAVAVRNECLALLSLIGEEAAEGIAQAVRRIEGGMELIEQLTPRERQVFGLKLAKKTRSEIAALLQLDHGQVDDVWRSIRRKAEDSDASTAD